MFDQLVDEMRSHTTEWLRRERESVVAAQRQLRTRELAVLRVLDERGRVDTSIGASGESARVVREKVETARALESLPAVGAVALDGGFSDAQLTQVARLADERSDAEWARRAPHIDPVELARLARNASKPTTDDSRGQYEARSLKMWWTRDDAMLHVHGQLPVLMGKTLEDTITKLTERMRPPRGQRWDSFEHRAADALLQLCGSSASIGEEHTPALVSPPVLQVSVPPSGPAEIAGIPIADTLLEQLRANATLELVLGDDDGIPVSIAKRTPGLSPKIARAVLLRDTHCRMPGCERRHGLEVHHLRPRSWGGTDEFANLVVVCATHHRTLVPHGTRALTGNPHQPDGLQLVDAAVRAPGRPPSGGP